MSKEARLISRRQAIKEMSFLGAAGLVAKAIAVVDGAVLGAKTAYGLAADVQPGLAELIVPFPEKGWLETSVPSRGAFITDEGHREYLRHLCLYNDVLADVTSKSFINLFDRDGNRPPYKWGEMLLEYVATAKKSIEEMKNTKNVPWEDILHVAILSLAAVLSPYITLEELKKWGVKIPDQYKANFPLLLIPEYQAKVPKVYPADPKTCHSKRDLIANCLGGDRANHVANNMAITFQYIYAKKYGLQDAERIPNGMKVVLGIFNNSIRRQAIALDRTAQWFWEAKETKDTTLNQPGEFGRDENGTLILSGFYDDKVWHDFKANELGLWAGLELSKDNITEEDIKEVARKLDYPSIYHVIPSDGRLTRSEMLDIFRSPQPPLQNVVVYANPDGVAALPVAA